MAADNREPAGAFASFSIDNTPHAQRIEKPWGYELLFTPPDRPYAGKLLHIEAGKRISLQYHDQKMETIVLLHGRAQLLVDNVAGELETIEMQLGHGYSNRPGQRHRLIAIEASDFLEASTPETGTTYRLEDDTGRGHETEQARSRSRGGEGDDLTSSPRRVPERAPAGNGEGTR